MSDTATGSPDDADLGDPVLHGATRDADLSGEGVTEEGATEEGETAAPEHLEPLADAEATEGGSAVGPPSPGGLEPLPAQLPSPEAVPLASLDRLCELTREIAGRGGPPTRDELTHAQEELIEKGGFPAWFARVIANLVLSAEAGATPPGSEPPPD
jgi:hypothetical protein